MAGTRKETLIIAAILLAVVLGAVLAFRSFATGSDGSVARPNQGAPKLDRHAAKRRKMQILPDGGRW